MADGDICPKCEVGSIRGNTCWKCGYKQELENPGLSTNHS